MDKIIAIDWHPVLGDTSCSHQHRAFALDLREAPYACIPSTWLFMSELFPSPSFFEFCAGKRAVSVDQIHLQTVGMGIYLTSSRRNCLNEASSQSSQDRQGTRTVALLCVVAPSGTEAFRVWIMEREGKSRQGVSGAMLDTILGLAMPPNANGRVSTSVS